MHQAVVPIAVPSASSRGVPDRGTPLEVADSATGMHVQCIVPSVQTAAMRRKCLFNHENIDQFIAVTAINRNVLAVQTTDDRVGNLYD
jgi:hypothetical protein